MRKMVIVLLVLLSQHSNACNTVEQAQKLALINNTFLILYFSETSAFSFKQAKEFFWLNAEDASLLDNYYQYTVYKDENKKYVRKYNISELPTVLIVDGNGKEIYRYNDYTNPTGMKDALKNFVIPKYFLMNDLNNFHQQKTFESAMRISQLYLDYSLKVEVKLRACVYRISEAYLEEAESFLTKKCLSCQEISQKMQLAKLSYLAYQKNFFVLDEKLAAFDPSALSESNSSTYYFLKYITAKALKSDDFPQIEQSAMQRADFDYISKKTGLILSEKDIAAN